MHLLQPDETAAGNGYHCGDSGRKKRIFYEADCRVRAKDESPGGIISGAGIVRYEEKPARPCCLPEWFSNITTKKEPQVPDMGQKDREENKSG
jgi:hypothetical protein